MTILWTDNGIVHIPEGYPAEERRDNARQAAIMSALKAYAKGYGSTIIDVSEERHLVNLSLELVDALSQVTP